MNDSNSAERSPRQLDELAPKIGLMHSELCAILAAGGLAAATATELGRALNLSKNLAWSVHRFAATDAHDLAGLLSAMPGVRGWDSVCSALRDSGHDRDAVTRLVASISKCAQHMHELGSGRELLAAKAASQQATRSLSREVVALRKAAMQARELALGVSVKVDIGCYLVAPSQQRGMVSVAALRMFDRLVQHRARPPWPLYLSMQNWSEGTATASEFRALDPHGDAQPLIQDLSTPGVLGNELTIAQQRDARNREFDFVGHIHQRSQPLCVCFGDVAPALGSMHCSGKDTHAELGCPLELPTSLCVFDLCMHRDVLRGREPHLRMFSSPDAAYSQRNFRERNELPPEAPLMKEHMKDLMKDLVKEHEKEHERGDDDELTTALVAELGDSAQTAARVTSTYSALRQRAAAALSSTLADYTRYRVVIHRPTTPSTLLVSWKLA